jgi:hypothetical protein
MGDGVRTCSVRLQADMCLNLKRLSRMRDGRYKRESVRKNFGDAGSNLSSAGVHFEVGILAQLIDSDENAAVSCGRAQLGAAVVASLPDG